MSTQVQKRLQTSYGIMVLIWANFWLRARSRDVSHVHIAT